MAIVEKSATSVDDSSEPRKEFKGPQTGDFVECEIVDVESTTRVMRIEGEEEERPRFMFTFKSVESEYAWLRLKGDTPQTYTDNENCTLWNWAKEIYADTPPDLLDTEQLKGKRCRVEVREGKTVPRKDGKGNWTYYWAKDVIRSRDAATSFEDPF
jgi:hypothetical protein